MAVCLKERKLTPQYSAPTTLRFVTVVWLAWKGKRMGHRNAGREEKGKEYLRWRDNARQRDSRKSETWDNTKGADLGRQREEVKRNREYDKRGKIRNGTWGRGKDKGMDGIWWKKKKSERKLRKKVTRGSDQNIKNRIPFHPPLWSWHEKSAVPYFYFSLRWRKMVQRLQKRKRKSKRINSNKNRRQHLLLL